LLGASPDRRPRCSVWGAVSAVRLRRDGRRQRPSLITLLPSRQTPTAASRHLLVVRRGALDVDPRRRIDTERRRRPAARTATLVKVDATYDHTGGGTGRARPPDTDRPVRNRRRATAPVASGRADERPTARRVDPRYGGARCGRAAAAVVFQLGTVRLGDLLRSIAPRANISRCRHPASGHRRRLVITGRSNRNVRSSPGPGQRVTGKSRRIVSAH
jgi:hypothetical protein